MRKIVFITVVAASVTVLSACGSKDSEALNVNSALALVSGTMDDMANLNPTASLNQSSVRALSDVGIFAAFGGAWTSSSAVKLPDNSDTSVSVKDFMGKQLDPDATGVGDGGRTFYLNVFGRFSNSMMIGCALGNLSATVDAATGYPAAGTETMTMTAANAAILVSNCGLTQSEADYFTGLTTPAAITATISIPADTTYYDRKVVMALDAQMGGATQTFYFRYNADAINILNAEDGASFDSRTVVALNRSTNVLRVEYYSGGSGNLYFHRLYYDQTNDIGHLATQYGSASQYSKYTLSGKPNTSSATMALSFKKDQNSSVIDASACVNPSTGDIATDNSLACTLTGTDVSSATVLTDALSRVGNASWVSTSDTLTLDYTADNVFTAVSP
jgi:hypothetical protein